MSKWQETKLSEIGNVISGGTPSTSIAAFWNGKIPFVTPFDLSRNNSAYIQNTERKISQEGLLNSSANLLPAGSIVISSRAPIGYIAIAKEKIVTNQGCKSIVPNSDFAPLYLYYCLDFYVDRIKRLGAGSTFAEISKADLESVKIPHPLNKAEQERIAKVLNSVDTLIQRTQAIITKYQAIKQGMLHDLFTRGIDVKIGKLRPAYEEAPKLYKKSELGMIPKDWSIDSFSSKMEVINGGTPSTNNKGYWNGIIPWLSVDDFNNGRRYVTDTSKKITIEGLKNSSTNLLQKGMVIISARGTVGVISQLGGQMAFNQSCYGLNSIDKALNNDFAYYFLLYYKERFGFNSFGSVFSTITRDYFDFIKMTYPENIEEATKIVSRLSSLDENLDTEKMYLQKLQQLKFGLMNDLLSGKKKVNLNNNDQTPIHKSSLARQ